MNYVMVDESHATVRAGPGVEYDALGQLRRNERATLIQDCGKWLKIKYGRRVGYVPARRCGVLEDCKCGKT